ncbi:MAG TPA: hypothetical protein H9820_00085 [Candidatus Companilactobacillus pullicola]|uniref:Uncharacterized protein n=1 Tax=Candidatus Companilactobacillus pullicola TaxID=2838523 RepID=A0A9D1ZK88_9LACO|nr:hypothetical protein [Candidatus Companilactobacillus pullicola]
MNNSKLAKQEAQLKKLNAQIKEAKITIDKNLGHKLIAKLNLDYTDLDKDTINHLINQLAHLYQASEHHE